MIFDDVIFTISLDPKRVFAYEVRSKDLADVQRSVFELAWKQAKREDKEICK